MTKSQYGGCDWASTGPPLFNACDVVYIKKGNVLIASVATILTFLTSLVDTPHVASYTSSPAFPSIDFCLLFSSSQFCFDFFLIRLKLEKNIDNSKNGIKSFLDCFFFYNCPSPLIKHGFEIMKRWSCIFNKSFLVLGKNSLQVVLNLQSQPKVSVAKQNNW